MPFLNLRKGMSCNQEQVRQSIVVEITMPAPQQTKRFSTANPARRLASSKLALPML